MASDLDEVIAEIAALQQRQDENPASSFTGKAQAVATAAANKAKAETLKLKRSSLLKELGSKLRQNPTPNPGVVCEIATAETVQDRIKALDDEIEKLRSNSWVRRPLFVVVSIVTLGVLVMAIIATKAGNGQQAQHKPDFAQRQALIERIQGEEDAHDKAMREIAQRRQAELDRFQRDMAATQKSQDDYLEKQATERAAQEQAAREKAKLEANLQQQMAQKQEESRKQAQEEQEGKVGHAQDKEKQLSDKRQQIAAVIVRTKAKIEEQDLAPTGTAVKYKVSSHAIHLAAATLKGSRHIMRIDGVSGPPLDELIWVNGSAFQSYRQMLKQRGRIDGSMDHSQAPIVFSDDGRRSAYIGRAGNDFVVFLDGKEVDRGPYFSGAIESLSFTPGGRHLRYLEHLGEVGNHKDFLVVDGNKQYLANVPGSTGAISWSPDGEHYAYFKGTDKEGWQVIADGRPKPELDAPGYDPREVPIFTGDSAHIITVRRKRFSSKGQRSISDKIGAETIFMDSQPVLPAPEKRMYGNPVAAKLEEVSAAPAGNNFIAVFSMPDNNELRIFFNSTFVTAVHRIDYISWSPDGKRYAITCVSDHQSAFMIIDGKKEPEYKQIWTIGPNEYWSPGQRAVFTADSSKAVYVGRTDKAFMVVGDAESDGFDRIDKYWLGEKGSHLAFLGINGEDQTLVVDGQALEPRRRVSDFAFGPQDEHYTFLSGKENRGSRVFFDGAEQQAGYGGDFVHFTTSSQEDNRQCLISPDGKHLLYLAAIGQTDASGRFSKDHSPIMGVCLDGKVIPCQSERSEVRAYFTPDSRHVVWIDWDGKLERGGTRFLG